MALDARQQYKDAYHFIRTCESARQEWEHDTYPVSYECDRYNDCSHDNGACCSCWLAAQHDLYPHEATVREYQLIKDTPPCPADMMQKAIDSYLAVRKRDKYFGSFHARQRPGQGGYMKTHIKHWSPEKRLEKLTYYLESGIMP